MHYVLIDYVHESGWTELSKAEHERWMGAYRAYTEAMKAAGVLRRVEHLQPSASATTVRSHDGKPQVLDGPYADSKEQLGGMYFIEVADQDAALAWAARSPTVSHGIVEVRPLFAL